MGRRISKLPDQPTLKENDYLVVDGEDGTRKVPVDQSVVLSGPTAPLVTQGILGSTYVQYGQTGVAAVYFKTPTGWATPPAGGSYFKEFIITERDVSTSTFSVYETPSN
ncbi:MAG: hypothetical protein IJE78_05280 [Bacteroidaceae bacterium]|nr:hypothetical protein [Bacteroidaceae bacterium]